MVSMACAAAALVILASLATAEMSSALVMLTPLSFLKAYTMRPGNCSMVNWVGRGKR